MTSIADLFAADLAELKRRSDETDRKMQASLDRMHRLVAEWKRLDDALLSDLA
jgi:hypothetical protein